MSSKSIEVKVNFMGNGPTHLWAYPALFVFFSEGISHSSALFGVGQQNPRHYRDHLLIFVVQETNSSFRLSDLPFAWKTTFKWIHSLYRYISSRPFSRSVVIQETAAESQHHFRSLIWQSFRFAIRWITIFVLLQGPFCPNKAQGLGQGPMAPCCIHPCSK